MEPTRKTECTPEVVRKIQSIEDRSDKCYQELALLELPWNMAVWAALTDSIVVIEKSVPPHLYGSRHHINAVTNASFVAAQFYKLARQHGRKQTLNWNSLGWTPRLAAQCKHDFEIAMGYNTFCTVFPHWHADKYAVVLVYDNVARFVSQASPLGRRINAYQQGIRPTTLKNESEQGMQTGPTLQRLLARSLGSAKRISRHGVVFLELRDLWEALYAAHEMRTRTMGRRYPELRIGDYDLEDFRKCYSAINAIAAAHEFLCYRWSQENGLPFDSLLLFEHRFDWVRNLSRLASLSREQVYAMLKDLTFGRVHAVNFHLLPFVPLKEDRSLLALAPYCSLSSNWEENILGCLSRLDPARYSRSSVTKEEEMRRPLVARTSGIRLISGGYKLPSPLPDIDLLVEDIAANILIIGELKWVRKPSGQKDRESRDKEVLKGFSQIEKIRTFLMMNPSYLPERCCISQDLSRYKSVHYCVVARDHLVEPPEGAVPLYSYDSFLAEFTNSENTAASLNALERLEWLPVEGVDFSVQFDRHNAGGVAVESETYYPAGRRLVLAR